MKYVINDTTHFDHFYPDLVKSVPVLDDVKEDIKKRIERLSEQIIETSDDMDLRVERLKLTEFLDTFNCFACDFEEVNDDLKNITSVDMDDSKDLQLSALKDALSIIQELYPDELSDEKTEDLGSRIDAIKEVIEESKGE